MIPLAAEGLNKLFTWSYIIGETKNRVSKIELLSSKTLYSDYGKNVLIESVKKRARENLVGHEHNSSGMKTLAKSKCDDFEPFLYFLTEIIKVKDKLN